MGDENSLAGTTKAHKHTSPASDGGFLETTETGVTNMSAGSLGYYNSSSVLQELSIGSASDQIRVNAGATAPEYFTPSGGGATLTRGYEEFTSSWSTTSLTFVDVGAGPLDITLQAGAGMALCFFETYLQSAQAMVAQWVFGTDGTQTAQRLQSSVSGKFSRILTGLTSTLSAQSVKPQVKNQDASTLYLCPDSEGKTSITVLEIS